MFDGIINGSANSASRPFTGVVDGVTSFFGAFSGVVSGVASFFGRGGGGGGATRAGLAAARARSNESVRNWVDPTTTSKALQLNPTPYIPETPKLPESMQQQHIPSSTGKKININLGDTNIDIFQSDTEGKKPREIGNSIGEGMVEVLEKELRRLGG